MKIAYLILAHNNPCHLKKLIKALVTENSSVFVHIDRKAEEPELLSVEARNVHYTKKRHRVFWGDFSQVDAILQLLYDALSFPIDFDRFVLLSGVDYPLATAEEIEFFFSKNQNQEYINLVKMPSNELNKPISRLTTFKPKATASPLISLFNSLIFPLIRRTIRRDFRKYFVDLTPYGGSTWWALSRDAAEYVVAFSNENKRLVEFLRNSVCPDEMFFQTIIGNSHFANNVSANITYADWSDGRSNPAILKAHTIKSLIKDGRQIKDLYGEHNILFARKFTDSSHKELDSIDKIIGSL